MATYRENFLRWREGRQGTGYEKLLLLVNPYLLPFDLYILRYRQGSEIPLHTDPVEEKRHYRLNVELRSARVGGKFICEKPILELPRFKLFRPDASPHAVTRIEAGTRYVLSLGWVLPSTK